VTKELPQTRGTLKQMLIRRHSQSVTETKMAESPPSWIWSITVNVVPAINFATIYILIFEIGLYCLQNLINTQTDKTGYIISRTADGR